MNGILKLGNTYHFDFRTHNVATGTLTDADSLPTCKVFEDANDTPILTPTVQKRGSGTGGYTVPVAATSGNGFEAEKSYNVEIAAAVNSISAQGVVGQFTLSVSDVDDVVAATGTNTVNFTVVDGAAAAVSGAVIAVRTSAGGANVRPGLTTSALGKATTSLDAGTYYVQLTLNGYTHTEETVVVDEDPEAVAVTMTAVTIGSPVSASAHRVFAYPYDIDASVDSNVTIPLFTCKINKPSQNADGVIVEDTVVATRDNGAGYWYVDAYALDELTAMDGSANTALSYIWTLRNSRTLTRRVDSTDGASVNLISGLD